MQKAKRFYKTVSTALADEGWQVLLDGKPIRTPGKNPLILPNKALAEAIVDEWREQGDQIVPDSMPIMQFSCAAIDYVLSNREEVLAETAGYAATDVLCYRVDEPKELVDRQYEQWQPLIDWAERRYHVNMQVTAGIMPVEQEGKTLAVLRAELETLPAFTLTAVWLITKHCSSLLLALAVYQKYIIASKAYAISRLDENFQNEKWGEDEEARQKRESSELEITALERFLLLVSA